MTDKSNSSVQFDISSAKRVAELASLAISEEESERLALESRKILEFVSTLSSVNTDGIPGTCHVHGAVNAMRKDIVSPSLPTESLKRNAPDFANLGFKVHKVIA